jgi:hypothetical protein
MSLLPRAAVVILLLAAGVAVRAVSQNAIAGSPGAAGSPEKSTRAATPGSGVPTDTRERWTVGIAAFRGEGLDPSDAWLSWSVPLLLRDQVAGLSVHDIDAEGRDALARSTIARDRRALLASIERLRDARDAAAIEGTSATLSGAVSALAEAMTRLARLDGLALSAVTVADHKPIAFKAGPEPGLLLAAPFGSRAEAAEREDVDLLVGGSVQEASGYFIVDVWAWDAARDATLLVWRDAATREQLYDRLAEAGRELTGVLLGRTWASLEVTADPPGATVLVDGKPPGTGRSRFDDLAPGSHEVRASAPGRRDEVRTVDLAARTVTTLSISLAPVDHGTISVTSDPPGADAWLDTVWQGITPLAMPRPDERARLVVAIPDGPEAALTVGPDSPAQVSFTLSLDAPGAEAAKKLARDRFYGAFGWLVLSLPVPFYSYSWAADWAAEARRLAAGGDTAGAQRAVDIGTGFYWTYLGGLGVSVTLAGWTIYRIVRYVSAAGNPSARGVTP